MTTLLDTTTQALGSALTRSTRHAVTTTQATPDDKLDYKPTETARSVREMAQHIILGNNLCLSTLGLDGDCDTSVTAPGEIAAEIEKGGKRLAEFALQADESALTREVSFFGDLMTAASLLMTAEWHMSRHSGQIDYVQTTWGDLEDHMFGE